MVFASWSGVARVMTSVSSACLSPQKMNPPPSRTATKANAAYRNSRDRLMPDTIRAAGPNSADDHRFGEYQLRPDLDKAITGISRKSGRAHIDTTANARLAVPNAVSYTHLTLPTNREV